jgi:NAD(P)-dependent dehydrogenase (short-subunit alcohol dehydrogenase family)
MSADVAVVIGAGGIGQAIARRQGSGRTVRLADCNETVLGAAEKALADGGHTVSTREVDVSSRESVRALAQAAAGLGPVVNVVNTAGLSPVQAPPAAILAVDLVGTALVFEEFETVIAPGGAGLVISSMAGHMPPPLDRERGSPGTPNDPPCLRRPAGGYLEPWPSATPRGRTTTSCFPITSPP